MVFELSGFNQIDFRIEMEDHFDTKVTVIYESLARNDRILRTVRSQEHKKALWPI